MVVSVRQGNDLVARQPASGQEPNHSTPYLDLVLPPCAVICLLISMYAVLGIGLDWHSGTWRVTC